MLDIIMNRHLLETPDEDLAAEFGRVLDLFSRGFRCRSDLAAFCNRVNAAAAQGYTWIEALEQAADR